MGNEITGSCLVVFAREPREGKVKTRLSPPLSQKQCLALYKDLLKDTVALVDHARCDSKVMAYESGGQEPAYLTEIAPDFEFYPQRGDDLGARMHDVFDYFLKDHQKVVIMGSDSPDLPVSHITRAFKELDQKDLVLGPTYDGGYYLIGLKKACVELFENVQWSTGSVFETTLRKAKELNKQCAVLDHWRDIDTPEDLKYLKREKYMINQGEPENE